MLVAMLIQKLEINDKYSFELILTIRCIGVKKKKKKTLKFLVIWAHGAFCVWILKLLGENVNSLSDYKNDTCITNCICYNIMNQYLASCGNQFTNEIKWR